MYPTYFSNNFTFEKYFQTFDEVYNIDCAKDMYTLQLEELKKLHRIQYCDH